MKYILYVLSHKKNRIPLFAFFLICSFFGFSHSASAATKYWVGNAGDSFTAATSWSLTQVACSGAGSAGAPASGDALIFGSTCNSNATVTATPTTFASLTIQSGYTQTITVNSAVNMTMTTTFSQAGGTFTGNTGTMSVGTTFTLSGGTFNAGSATTTITGIYTHNAGGTFNAGTGTVYFVGNQTITTSGDTFNNLTLGTPNATLAGSAITVNGTLTENLNGCFAGGITINAKGTVTLGTGGSNCTSVVTVNGVGSQTVTASGLNTSAILITNASATMNLNANSSFYSLNIQAGIVNTNNYTLATQTTFSQSGGTFNGGSSATMTITTSFTLSAGTFNAPSGTLTVTGGFTHNAGGTFNAGTGTAAFSGNQTINTSGDTFNNLSLIAGNATQVTLSGSSITVNGTLAETVTCFSTASAVGVNAKGSITVGAAGGSCTAVVTANGAGTQTISVSGTSGQALALNNASSTMTLTGNATIHSLNLQAGIVNMSGYTLGTYVASGNGFAQSGGTFNQSTGTFTIGTNSSFALSGGTFNTGVSSTISMAGGTFTVSGGTFNGQTSTINCTGTACNITHAIGPAGTSGSGGAFNPSTMNLNYSGVTNGQTSTINVNGDSFNNVTFDGAGNTSNITITGNMIILGTFTNTRGIISGTINVKGDMTTASTAGNSGTTPGSGTININGTSTQAITFNGGGLPNMVINNASSTVTYNALTTFLTLTLTALSGSFNLNTYGITLTSTLTINGSGATLNAGSGNITFTVNTGTLTVSAGTFNGQTSTLVCTVAGGCNITHSTGPAGTANSGGAFNSTTMNLNYTAMGNNQTTTFNVNGDSFNNVTFDGTVNTFNMTVTGTMTILGTFTFNKGSINTGTINVKGDMTVASTASNSGAALGSGAITVNGTGSQTITYNGGGLPTYTISNATTTNTYNTATTFKGFTLSAGSTFGLNAVAFNISSGGFTQSAGTFNAGSSAISMLGSVSIAGGTFNAQTSTITNTWASGVFSHSAGTFNTGSSTIVFSGLATGQHEDIYAPGDTFWNFTVNYPFTTDFVQFDTNTSFTVLNNLNLTEGYLQYRSGTETSGTVNIQGNTTIGANWVTTATRPVTIVFNGSGAQTIDQSSQGGSLVSWAGGVVNITNPGGTLQLLSNIKSTNAPTVSSTGSLDLNSYTWTPTPTFSGTVIFSGNSCTIPGPTYGSISVQASCTLTGNVIVATTTTITSAGTLILNGYSFSTVGLTMNSSSNLRLKGDENFNVTGTVSNSGTVTYIGNGDSLANTYSIKNISYYNLTTAFTDTIDTLIAYLSPATSTGMVAWWKLDEPSGTAIGTAVGTYTGTANTTITRTTSVPPLIKFADANAFTFAGAQRVDIPSTGTILAPTNSWTVALWQKKSVQYPGEYFSTSWTGSTLNPFMLFRSAASDANNDYLGMTARNDASTQVTGWTSNPFPKLDANWHHIAYVSNGSSIAGYVDGVSVGQSTYGFAGVYTLLNQMTIGVLRRASSQFDGYFTGSLDDVRVYSRALSASEVASLASGYNDASPTLSSLTVSGVNTLSSGVFSAPVTMTVTGNYTQSGTSTFNASTTLNLASDFSVTGASSTFSSASSTLNLTKNSGTQTFTASTTFYNLSKVVTNASTLKFTTGNVVTVTGTTTLKGAVTGQLSVQSTSATYASGSDQWKFDPQGSLDLAYLTLQNSNNINASSTNRWPTINANNYAGMVDNSNNTNWTFTVPTITLVATGTQVTTAPLPVTHEYMGGAFIATKNTSTSTVTSIKITQKGTLPTSYISNVQLLSAPAASNGTCATSSPISNAGAVEFGNSGTWSNSSATTTGSMSVGTTPVCIYTRFSLSGVLTLDVLGMTIDLEVTNPSTDIISSGVTVTPSTSINIQGIAVQTLVNGTVVLTPVVSLGVASSTMYTNASTTLTWSVTNNPTSCSASNFSIPSATTFSGSVSTGALSSSQTYVLTCRNTYGNGTGTTTVTIINPNAPVVSLSVASSSIATNTSTTLTWDVTNNPASCIATNFSIGTPTTFSGGPVPTGNLSQSTTYRLVCINSYGTATSTASVLVGYVPTPSQCTGGDADASVCGSGSGSTAIIALLNPDGTETKFLVTNGKLFKQIIASGGSGTILSSQNLTADGLSITSATFTKIGSNSLRAQLKIHKSTTSGGITDYTLEKTFTTSATTRGQ